MKDQQYVTRIQTSKAGLWKDKRPLLGKLDIELTERCNNNCIHCCINLPADDCAAKQKELSTEEVKGIFEEAASLGCLRLRLTGGEPLMREDFEELYLFARKLGLKVLIFTNATLITPHLAEIFATVPPLELIEISLYGMSKKSYEAVSRTPDSFEAAWSGMNLLLEKEVPFIIKSALLPPNIGEMEEFAALASTIPWMDNPPSFSMFYYFRNRRDSEHRNRLIEELRLTPADGFEVLGSFTKHRDGFLKNMRAFFSRSTGLCGDTLLSCGAGVQGGCVDAYGNFQPCMLLRHPDVIYDLRNGSLEDALTNVFPKIRRQLKARNPDYLARCARCFLKNLCEQCPGYSWTEYGTLDTPVEYHCNNTHFQARALGLLEEGEMAWEVEDWEERVAKFIAEEASPEEIPDTEKI